MVEVKRVKNRLMLIKLVIEDFTLNGISAYTLQLNFDEEEKKSFCEVLDEVVRDVPSTKKIFVNDNFNGRIESLSGGYDNVHGGFDFGES